MVRHHTEFHSVWQSQRTGFPFLLRPSLHALMRICA